MLFELYAQLHLASLLFLILNSLIHFFCGMSWQNSDVGGNRSIRVVIPAVRN
jgi:hypothetical protein